MSIRLVASTFAFLETKSLSQGNLKIGNATEVGNAVVDDERSRGAREGAVCSGEG